MKVPDCITNNLKELRNCKRKSVYIYYATKAHEALVRYYLCKNENRKKSHYADYMRFNYKSFRRLKLDMVE